MVRLLSAGMVTVSLSSMVTSPPLAMVTSVNWEKSSCSWAAVALPVMVSVTSGSGSGSSGISGSSDSSGSSGRLEEEPWLGSWKAGAWVVWSGSWAAAWSMASWAAWACCSSAARRCWAPAAMSSTGRPVASPTRCWRSGSFWNSSATKPGMSSPERSPTDIWRPPSSVVAEPVWPAWTSMDWLSPVPVE